MINLLAQLASLDSLFLSSARFVLDGVYGILPRIS